MSLLVKVQGESGGTIRLGYIYELNAAPFYVLVVPVFALLARFFLVDTDEALKRLAGDGSFQKVRAVL